MLQLRESQLFQVVSVASVSNFGPASSATARGPSDALQALKRSFDALLGPLLLSASGSDGQNNATTGEKHPRLSVTDDLKGSMGELVLNTSLDKLASSADGRAMVQRRLSDDPAELKECIAALCAMITDATMTLGRGGSEKPGSVRMQAHPPSGSDSNSGSRSDSNSGSRSGSYHGSGRPRVSTWYTRGSSVASLLSPCGSVYRQPPQVQETDKVVLGRDDDDNKTINNYVILGELGKGSFGKVKLAEHQNSAQLFAIKVIKMSVFGKKVRPQIWAKLQTEIQVMKIISHPSIVRLHEVMHNQEQEKIYLVMDYVIKGSLVRVLPDGTCDPVDDELLKLYARQLARAVSALHRSNIFHRDIKPDNVLLGDNDKVFLADFGVSVICSEEGVEGVEGTPAYMAPELCRGELNVRGDRVDVWALGVTLFQLMYGRLPFAGDSFLHLTRKIVNDSFVCPQLTPRGALVPPAFIQLIKGMLAKETTARWSMKQVRQCDWLRDELEDKPAVAFVEDSSSSNSNKAGDAAGAAITRIRSVDICETPTSRALEEKRRLCMATAALNQVPQIAQVESCTSGTFSGTFRATGRRGQAREA